MKLQIDAQVAEYLAIKYWHIPSEHDEDLLLHGDWTGTRLTVLLFAHR